MKTQLTCSDISNSISSESLEEPLRGAEQVQDESYEAEKYPDECQHDDPPDDLYRPVIHTVNKNYRKRQEYG